MRSIPTDSIIFHGATFIGGVSVGDPEDPDFALEQLSRITDGRYILYAEGGPCSQYADHCDYCGLIDGSYAFELSYEEARDWGRKYLGSDDYNRFFGSGQVENL